MKKKKEDFGVQEIGRNEERRWVDMAEERKEKSKNKKK